MGTIWKNEKQTEFCALLQEMESAGFTKAAVAGLLDISPAAVTQFFTGKATPKSTTIALFHHIVDEALGRKQPDTKREIISVDGVHEKLTELKQKDPSAYAHAKTNIEFLHDRATQKEDLPRTAKPVDYRGDIKKKPNLNVDQIAEQLAMREVSKYPPRKKKSEKPTGKTSPPVSSDLRETSPKSPSPSGDHSQS